MANIKDFRFKTFEKQLAYENRTFLRGEYDIETGACTFSVVHNGKVFGFPDLEEAIDKFNEEVKNAE